MTSNAAAASRVLLGLALTGLLSACGDPTESGDKGGDESAGGESNGAGGTDDAAPAEITSTEVIADLSLADFTADCDEAGGVVEQHASCGGVNTCAGFSYDDASDALTHHTCAGLNTCSGFSCVTG